MNFLNEQEFSTYSFSKKSVYAEEFATLHELSASDSFAVKFTYSTPNKASGARTVILKRIKDARMPLDAIQRKTDVIVYKKGE
jgi:hypothetical protein